MVENDLTLAIRKFIEKVVENYRMPVKNGAMRAPVVINGYLPPKRSNSDDDFPFVVVRPESGQSDEDMSQATVSIIVGCYTDETDGHEYCLNVMSRIRNALCSMDCGTLAKKYQIRMPIEWTLPQEQPYPQWQLDMTTQWVYHSPQIADIYGGTVDHSAVPKEKVL